MNMGVQITEVFKSLLSALGMFVLGYIYLGMVLLGRMDQLFLINGSFSLVR